MLKWLLTLARVLLGVLIVKTGVDFVKGAYIFSGFSNQEPFLTGLFIILLGIHIIFSSTIKWK